MGILDSLENSDAFKGVLGQLESAVIPVVLSEVLGNGSQGGVPRHLSAKIPRRRHKTQMVLSPCGGFG